MGRPTPSNNFLCSLILCLALVLHPSPASSFTITARNALASLQASRRQNDICQQMNRLNPMEPGYDVQSEAGKSSYWNENEEQLQCAGLNVARHEIQNRGLLVPHYSTGHKIFYVLQGRAVGGVVIPGCTPTFHSYTGSGQGQSQGGGGRRFGPGQQAGSQSQYSQWDEHQKIHDVYEGHVVAVPSGLAAWFYNNGNSPLILLEVLDVGNLANQLDAYPRTFFLAGSEESLQGGGRQQQGQQGQQQQQQGQQQGQQGSSSRSIRGGHGSEYPPSNNIFQGFDTELLAQVFGTNPQTVQKLQSFQDTRGFIIQVQDEFELSLPESEFSSSGGQGQHSARPRGSSSSPRGGSSQSQQGQGQSQSHSQSQQGQGSFDIPTKRGQQGQQGSSTKGGSSQVQESSNGMEESVCNVRLATNIANPNHADAYSREAGHVTVLNSVKLPVLDNIELSVEKGHLHRNAILAPYWNGNAHELIYAARGSARIQIVDHNGNAVLDDTIREGQLVLVPQGFATVEMAEEDEFLWVSIRTNGNPVTNQIVGETSVLNGIPEDVLSNAFYLERDEVKQIKLGRVGESVILSPSYYSQQQGQSQRGQTRAQFGLAVVESEPRWPGQQGQQGQSHRGSQQGQQGQSQWGQGQQGQSHRGSQQGQQGQSQWGQGQQGQSHRGSQQQWEQGQHGQSQRGRGRSQGGL